MELVEIGDAAVAYDDPISLQTYLLVMRNVLLSPTMDHNLIPLFLIWAAGLYVNETPKHQAPVPTIENHVIVDSETGTRIYLSLNGIFSYFPTRELTLEEVEEWESYPVVFITPDGNDWDPYASHFADNEAAIRGSSWLI